MADMLTTTDVAEKLHVTPATVYRWAHSGTIPSTRIGRILRFRPEDIEALSSHGIAAQPQATDPMNGIVAQSEEVPEAPSVPDTALTEAVLNALAEMVADHLRTEKVA